MPTSVVYRTEGRRSAPAKASGSERLCAASAESGSAPAASRADVNAEAERLLERYGNSILRLAYSYLHNQSDAEEIVQDTLVQYLKEAPVRSNLSRAREQLKTVLKEAYDFG